MIKPLVTVVTITYNLIKDGREKFVRQCIESVKNQTYPNIEHIIIDGASADGTLEIFKDYPWLKVYSEPDSGIYDAMNKGVAHANGKYIAFLNSDDFWHDNRAVEVSVNALEENNADFSYAPCTYIDKNDEVEGYSWPAVESFFARVPFCHQTSFTKTELVKFDTRYKVLADFNLYVTLFLSEKKGILVPLNFTSYRHTGISSGSDARYGNASYSLSMIDIKNILIKNLSQYGLKEKDIEPLHYKGAIDRRILKNIIKDVEPILAKKIQRSFLRIHSKRILMDKLAGMRKIQVLFNARDLNAPEADSIINNIVKHKDVDIFLYAEPDVVIPEKYKNIPLFAGRIREIDAFCSPVSKIPLRIKQSNVHIYKSEKDLIFHPTDDIKNIYIKGIYKVHFGDFSIFKVSVNHGVIKYYLFKLLPVYKIVANAGGENHYLFNFIKILSIKI